MPSLTKKSPSKIDWGKLIRPAVFGAFDGLTAILGVILSLTHQQHLILPTALGVAFAEGVGMAMGEWLSDSDSGASSSVVIGAATAVGSVLPSLPFAFFPWPTAVILSVMVFMVAGIGISLARESDTRTKARAFGETFSVIVLAALAVALSQTFFSH